MHRPKCPRLRAITFCFKVSSTGKIHFIVVFSVSMSRVSYRLAIESAEGLQSTMFLKTRNIPTSFLSNMKGRRPLGVANKEEGDFESEEVKMKTTIIEAGQR